METLIQKFRIQATLTEQELIDANRIIDEEEINSYQKLFKNLSAK